MARTWTRMAWRRRRGRRWRFCGCRRMYWWRLSWWGRCEKGRDQGVATPASNLREVQEVAMSEKPEKAVRTDAEWRARLTAEQYRVLREKGTGRPFTGALTENHESGNYHCAGCGALLFLSGSK